MTKATLNVPELHGFRPITEGYQPGSQILQKGFTPLASASPARPPSGGSSAAKPTQATAGSAPLQQQAAKD